MLVCLVEGDDEEKIVHVQRYNLSLFPLRRNFTGFVR